MRTIGPEIQKRMSASVLTTPCAIRPQNILLKAAFDYTILLMHLLDAFGIPAKHNYIVQEFGDICCGRQFGAGDMLQRVKEDIINNFDKFVCNPGTRQGKKR
jgi:hypothetical protein